VALKPGPLPVAACEAGDATLVLPAAAPSPPARAVWLDRRLMRWPGVNASGRFTLHPRNDMGRERDADPNCVQAFRWRSWDVCRPRACR